MYGRLLHCQCKRSEWFQHMTGQTHPFDQASRTGHGPSSKEKKVKGGEKKARLGLARLGQARFCTRASSQILRAFPALSCPFLPCTAATSLSRSPDARPDSPCHHIIPFLRPSHHTTVTQLPSTSSIIRCSIHTDRPLDTWPAPVHAATQGMHHATPARLHPHPK